MTCLFSIFQIMLDEEEGDEEDDEAEEDGDED